MGITDIVSKQRIFYESKATLSLNFRLKALSALRAAIMENEQEINLALNIDLGKPTFESYMTEIGMVLDELTFFERHLKGWVRPRRVRTPLAQFHAKSFIVPEPYGNVLIMSPWNYPFMLTLTPLIGAVAAGNCVTVKPSAYSPKTSAVIAKIIAQAFNPLHVSVIEGGRAENSALLEEKFDFIFFTGSVNVGKLVMEKASRNLTPVILELGGKSPCIVDESASLKLAARRIAFGKYLNCGQTCVAPDYLLIHKSVRDEFLTHFKAAVTEFFGDKPLNCPDYGHIVNAHHFERLTGLINKSGKIFLGGKANDKLQIEPTVLCDVSLESPIMQEEIFGPVLPVITFDNISQAEKIIKSYPKPLALYLFTNNKATEREFLQSVSFGGGCINDTIIHLATSRMGFGGVGESGMGGYHGKLSFEAFSHLKSIVKKYNWIDLPVRYRPYTNLKQQLLRLIMK